MLQAGVSSVDADIAMENRGQIEFVLQERSTRSSNVIGRVGAGQFRPVLARFAAFARLDNLYGSQTLFAVEAERDDIPCIHRFSLFLCNEPTMSHWMRLYLYAIEAA